LDPAVRIGVLQGNPVAEDMLEAAQLVPVEGIVNTVLTADGSIAAVFAGDMVAAHDAACAFAQDCFAVSINRKADVVIAASAHTQNFVQTHKALFNAWQALKPGGRVILIAPCGEGLGGKQFEKWLAYETPDAIITALREQSDINGQTALSTREKAPSTVFVTELSPEDVARLGGRKAASLQEAIAVVLSEIGETDPTCYVMPNAAYTVPIADC
jgi:nickel-dependent lactate racemase